MTEIIAECGVNWRDLDEAKKLIGQVVWANCKYAKFQIFKEEQIKGHPKFNELKNFILNEEQVKELVDYGKWMDVEVFFSVMYPEAVSWLDKYVNRYKVRSTDYQNEELLKKIYATNKEIIVSIPCDKVVKKKKGIKYLYCVPEYPAKIESYDLKIAKQFDGISSHVKDLDFLKKCIDMNFKMLEVHVMPDNFGDYLEKDWSITMLALKELMEYAKEKYL